MKCRWVKFAAVELAAILVLAGCWAESSQAAATQATLPPFEKIEKAVLGYFAKLPDFEPGDIISQTDVKPVFERLKQLGWTVADRKAVLAAVPADGDFIVKNLRTPAGRKFMAQIAKYPEAYDRLDRLARLPHGKATVRALIRGPDGYKMVEYMTTARGGIEMGKMLSNAPGAANFNKPTGRLYTVELLLARLGASYTAAKKPADKDGKIGRRSR